MKRVVLILVLILAIWVRSGGAFVLEAPYAAADNPASSEATSKPDKSASAADSVQTEGERFPIITRVEFPRDYGYFIGDEIPLSVTIEVASGVVLDLVNLPRAGEQHGALEIRNFKLTTSREADEVTTYTAQYRMQYFGAAPVTVQFEPLEILYATEQTRDAVTHTYTYKSLLTQPVTVDISRIGPYRPTPAQEVKGPLSDSRRSLLWISGLVGAMCIAVAFGGWGRECWRAWKQRSDRDSSLSTAEKVLQQLREIDESPLASDAPLTPAVSQLGTIVRAYLHDTCGVSAYTLTPSELASRLEPSPEMSEVVGLLQRCDRLKYQPDISHKQEDQLLWEDAVTIFERID